MKILVCYDGEDDNTKLVEKAKDRAGESDATLYLLWVLTGSEVGVLDKLEPARKELGKVQASLQEDGIQSESKVMFGAAAAADSIIEYAKENAMDEIVIGVQKKSKMEKVIFGSTAQKVILDAPCPVLTVKA